MLSQWQMYRMASSTEGGTGIRMPLDSELPAVPAFQHTRRQVDPLRRLAAADMAAGEVGGIAGQSTAARSSNTALT